MNRAFILPRRSRRLRPYLDLTAMIDTVFNLLIFFAVASTLVGSRAGIRMELPTAETTEQVPERVVLALLPGQLPQVNGVEVPLDRLGAELNDAAGGNLQTQVVVMADRRVQYSELVGALDQARQAGYYRLALAAAPKQPEPPEGQR
jgi:biopolymer transport protein ExbD